MLSAPCEEFRRICSLLIGRPHEDASLRPKLDIALSGPGVGSYLADHLVGDGPVRHALGASDAGHLDDALASEGNRRAIQRLRFSSSFRR